MMKGVNGNGLRWLHFGLLQYAQNQRGGRLISASVGTGGAFVAIADDNARN